MLSSIKALFTTTHKTKSPPPIIIWDDNSAHNVNKRLFISGCMEITGGFFNTNDRYKKQYILGIIEQQLIHHFLQLSVI